MPVKIFFCYAHKDERLLNKLKAHLRPLQRQGLIDVWHDRDISAGTEWERVIGEQLNAADIILLLISPDFMNSDYCYSFEMKRAIERHESGHAYVIPIILRSVYWKDAPFSKLQALPKDARPVTGRGWHNIDEALADVAHGIQKVVEEIPSQKSGAHWQTASTSLPEQKDKFHSSEVILINASLDPQLSQYKQTIEGGKKIISHKEHLQKKE